MLNVIKDIVFVQNVNKKKKKKKDVNYMLEI